MDNIVYTDKEKCKGCIRYPICNSFQNFVDPDECRLFKRETDLVEVVRCKDCKNCEFFYPEKKLNEEPRGVHYCNLLKSDRNPDDYCSFGRRKDGKNG